MTNYVNMAASNTSCQTWRVDYTPAPRPGRWLSWLDVHIVHPLILEAYWQEWIPAKVAEAIVWPFYRFCCWTSQWDRPIVELIPPYYNSAA